MSSISEYKDSSLFLYSDYKQILDLYLRQRHSRGALSRAAEALNCQRSYLSRIMNGNLHLTPDQAYMLAQFWKLKPLEQDYFLCLVDYDRAASRSYRDHIKHKINELKKRNDSLSERMQRPQPPVITSQEAIYFSTWQWSAIHFVASIPQYQTIASLSEKLAIPKESLKIFLERLKEIGLVQNQGSRWEFAKGEFHISKDSPFVIQHHQNWRSKAVMDAQVYQRNNIHYTNIQTASRKDIAALKTMMLEFISESKNLLDPSPPEDCVVFLCDIFEI